MIHSIGPINVCTDFDIEPYKIDDFRKYAKIVFYLTSRDATTTSGSKAMAQTVVFMFSVTMTLTFDLCSIFCYTYCT